MKTESSIVSVNKSCRPCMHLYSSLVVDLVNQGCKITENNQVLYIFKFLIHLINDKIDLFGLILLDKSEIYKIIRFHEDI